MGCADCRREASPLHVPSPKVQPPFSEQSDVEMTKVRLHLPLKEQRREAVRATRLDILSLSSTSLTFSPYVGRRRWACWGKATATR